MVKSSQPQPHSVSMSELSDNQHPSIPGEPLDVQWQRVRARLRVSFGDAAFNSWLKPLALADEGAACKIVASRLGFVSTSSGQQLAVDHTLANTASVMFDAVLVPSGAASAQALATSGDAVHFVLEAYKHCKAICVIGDAVQLLRTLGINGPDSSSAAAGVVVGSNEATGRAQLAQDFIAAIAKHRHWGRANVDAVPA